MPRFLTPIIVKNEFVTGNETVSGDQTILGATSGRKSYWTTVSVESGLSANYATFTNDISGLAFYSNGSKLVTENDTRLTNSRSPSGTEWSSVYNNVTSNSASYVTLTGTQTLKNKTVVDWMTLVRGYNTTPTLSATIPTGEVYTYVYTSSPSNITYYRYIATNGTEDAFYTYFSDTTLSGLVASKSIIL